MNIDIVMRDARETFAITTFLRHLDIYSKEVVRTRGYTYVVDHGQVQESVFCLGHLVTQSIRKRYPIEAVGLFPMATILWIIYSHSAWHAWDISHLIT